MKEVLFHPFDLGRWLTIGFCAFLATLSEAASRGGSGFNFKEAKNSTGADFNTYWDKSVSYLGENLIWIVPTVVGVGVVVLAVALLVLWLSSQGHFMFLDNVVTNRAEVIRPWQTYHGLGNSLFRFRLILVVVGGLLTLLSLGLGMAAAFPMLRQGEVNFPGMSAVMLALGSVFLVGLTFLIVAKVTKDWVVPLMWLRGYDWRAGWAEIGGLARAHAGTVVLYLLFQLLLNLVVAVLLVVVVLLSCCVAGCLLAIPYVGTVLFLPVLVFFRAYSVCFLAQFGPEYDLFRNERAMVTSSTA